MDWAIVLIGALGLGLGIWFVGLWHVDRRRLDRERRK
jgi:hypothetical protein